MNKFNILAIMTIILVVSCEKIALKTALDYACTPTFQDSSVIHPKAEVYQNILTANQQTDLIGATLLIKDKDGLWQGSSGYADVANKVALMPCQPMLIASISKVFTATVIFSLVDEGVLTIEDNISQWLGEEVINNLANAKDAKIKHLLSHTSGIPDYYTLSYEAARFEKEYNNWRQEDVLAFTFSKPATNTVGATYYYSNTNFLLLGIIAENASGEKLADLYQSRIFSPLNLASAYFGTDKPLPDGIVKGYADIYGNGQFVETEFAYKDELNTGDGGIAINAYDLARFIEALHKGQIISQTSVQAMENWFDLPQDWQGSTLRETKNGYGLEYFENEKGYAIGHTGAVDGFLSTLMYYPEEDITYIFMTNTIGDAVGRSNNFKEILDVMFE